MSSIVKEATSTARRAVLMAFAATTALAGVCFCVMDSFENAHRDSSRRLVMAQHAADRFLLSDERLTMSARLAVATGAQAWIDRYNTNLPVNAEALAQMSVSAPPDFVERFNTETRAANARLANMEKAAFAALKAGNAAAALAILESDAYRADKDVILDGARRFNTNVLTLAREDIEEVERRSDAILPFVLLISVLGGALLWRRLNRTLARSEAAYLSAEGKIRDLALNDSLTGIANRRALFDHLQAAVARAGRSRAQTALLMIDLDSFKPINDAHGHIVGDLVLKEVARRMNEVLRAGEFRARYGGDEFAVVIEQAQESDVRRAAERLIAAVSEPMRFGEIEARIGASIGVALYPSAARDHDDLLRKADAALYRAKHEGRGQARVYNPTMHAEILAHDALEADLRQAVAANALKPYFQPQVDLRTGAVLGFEILARWRDDARGFVPPADFVPVAEAAGLIDEITVSLLRAACVQMRDHPGNASLTLNLAPHQVQSEWLAQKILAVLTETGFAPQRLEVDVTEAALFVDIAAAKRTLTSLKNIGVRVALDDFAIGYSSLRTLSELPLDRLKIDSSFVRTLDQRDEAARTAAAVIGLGKSLGLSVLAEGVESAAQAEILAALGCDGGQGYHFGRPAPAAQALQAAAPMPAIEDVALDQRATA